MHRPIINIIFIIGLLFSTHLSAAPWQSDRYILSSFNKIALNGSKVKKWQTPIYYQIKHQIADRELHEKLVSTHMEQLRQITGLTIKPASKYHKANFTIVLTDEHQFNSDIRKHFKLKDLNTVRSLSNNNIGATSISTTSSGAIKQSIVILPTDRARAYGRLLTSLAEMLTKAIGMQFQSPGVFPSIFNYRSTDRFLTGLDYMMLKLLYDKRVRPGMSSHRFTKLASSMIKEKTYRNHIRQASLAVRQSGLNTLVN